MNNSYNYSDFIGMGLTANNEVDHYSTQPELQQVSTQPKESSADKHIEEMLLNHSRYHIYCE